MAAMRPSIQLPIGVRVGEVAAASRQALDDFLALHPQDSQALGDWFSGAYRRAVDFTGRQASPTSTGARLVSRDSAKLPGEDLVAHVQAAVRVAKDTAANGSAELVALLPPLVAVVPVHDAEGGHGFAPLNEGHARLATRVLTLLLAHYLTCPGDYFRASRSQCPTFPDTTDRPTLPSMRAVNGHESARERVKRAP